MLRRVSLPREHGTPIAKENDGGGVGGDSSSKCHLLQKNEELG